MEFWLFEKKYLLSLYIVQFTRIHNLLVFTMINFYLEIFRIELVLKFFGLYSMRLLLFSIWLKIENWVLTYVRPRKEICQELKQGFKIRDLE